MQVFLLVNGIKIYTTVSGQSILLTLMLVSVLNQLSSLNGGPYAWQNCGDIFVLQLHLKTPFSILADGYPLFQKLFLSYSSQLQAVIQVEGHRLLQLFVLALKGFLTLFIFSLLSMLLLLPTAVVFGAANFYHVSEVFEKTTEFSYLSEREREITFKTENVWICSCSNPKCANGFMLIFDYMIFIVLVLGILLPLLQNSGINQ